MALKFGTKLTVTLALVSVAQLANSSTGTINLSSCARPHYEVRAIPFIPNAINDSGKVVGRDRFHHAITWTFRDDVKQLQTPESFQFAEAVGINTLVEVVVNATNTEGTRHQAFIYSHGTFTALPGDQTIARGINDSHVIVGEAIVAGETMPSAVAWVDKALRPISICCGSTMKGINKNGVMIGDRYDELGRYHAFSRDRNQELKSIGPENGYSAAIAINDADHVLIQAFPDIYLYSSEGLTIVKMSKFPNGPHALSNCDVIVGSFGPYSDKDRAFIWDRTSGFQDLNDLIPVSSGWKLEAAVGMNSRGEIIGRGEYEEGDDQGYVLIPHAK
jgi:uncharacterized membrane protein